MTDMVVDREEWAENCENIVANLKGGDKVTVMSNGNPVLVVMQQEDSGIPDEELEEELESVEVVDDGEDPLDHWLR